MRAVSGDRTTLADSPIGKGSLHGPVNRSPGNEEGPGIAGPFFSHLPARDADQANGSCRIIVWSRSAPVETMAIGQLASSSTARR